MVEGLQKIVEPLHISEDPTQKMVGGKMIFINEYHFFGNDNITQNSRMIFVTC